FLVRMWLLLAWPHLYLPEAVFRKRLAAARLVLILGIGVSLRNLELAWAVAVATLSILPMPVGRPSIRKESAAGPGKIKSPGANRADHYRPISSWGRSS